MNSSIVELKLPLGDSLGTEVEKRAASLKLKPEGWISLFLTKRRLTPNVVNELALTGKERLFLPLGR